MRIIAGLGLAAITAVSGCTPSGTPIAGEKVSSVYSTYRINWRGESSHIEFRYTVKNVDGKVAVCGAYREAENGNGEQSFLTDQVAENGIIRIRGEKILHGVRFFSSHGPAKSLYGKAASCVVTEKPWLNGYSRKSATMVAGKTSYAG
ncbi:MAG: hypothetical protein ACPGGK_00905 [Pikeienuella sp.]